MLHLPFHVLRLLLFCPAGLDPEGAATAGDEEETAFPSVLLTAGWKLKISGTRSTLPRPMSVSEYLLSGPNKCSIF